MDARCCFVVRRVSERKYVDPARTARAHPIRVRECVSSEGTVAGFVFARRVNDVNETRVEG